MSAPTTVDLGDIEIRFLVEADDPHGAATVFECEIRPEAKVPAPHSHDGFEETVYGLAGLTSFTVDGEAALEARRSSATRLHPPGPGPPAS